MARVPQRVRLQRSRGWRKPEGVIVVSRPSKFGNPFRVGDIGPTGDRIATREQAVALFREWMDDSAANDRARDAMLAALPELRGRDLACWCPLDGPCHADVLLRLANR